MKLLLFPLIAAWFVSSCTGTQESPETASDLIEITGKQFATDCMTLGEVENRAFEKVVRATGTMVLFPDGLAYATAPIPGLVRSVLCRSGQYVEKGQDLVTIAGTEVIDLQKEYAEAAALFNRLKNDYERAKALYEETVTSEKDYVLTESSYKSAMAAYTAARLKVEAIGFKAELIENGRFYDCYTLKAPISGHLSKLSVTVGRYIDPQAILAEITNTKRVQLKLSVFSGDVQDLKTGQLVRFTTLNTISSGTARISAVGVSVDEESKTINCFADIDPSSGADLIAGEYVEAVIVTASELCQALPAEAILKTETGFAILVLSKQENGHYFFKKTGLLTGRQDGGYTEIPGERITGKILTSGVYNVAL